MLMRSIRGPVVLRRITIWTLVSIFAALFGGVLFCKMVADQNYKAQLEQQADRQLLAEVDLGMKTWENEPVAQFSIDDTAEVGLYFSLQNLDTAYFELSLQGPDGYQTLILHSEDYRTDDNGAGWVRLRSTDGGTGWIADFLLSGG